MKKFLSILAVVCAFTASAQVKFEPGVRAGVNFSQLTQTDLDSKTDYYVGVFGGIRFTKVYTLAPEITLSNQGAKGSYQINGYYFDENDQYVEFTETRKANVKLQYLSLSVNNKFTFKDRFMVMVGPTLDFQTNSNVRTNSDVDLGINFGIGYKTPIGLAIEARFKKGIVDVLDSDFTDTNDYWLSDYNTNMVFQIGLSYSFDIK